MDAAVPLRVLIPMLVRARSHMAHGVLASVHGALARAKHRVCVGTMGAVAGFRFRCAGNSQEGMRCISGGHASTSYFR
eukprot:6462466-Alexandrium_andersonii.AAC.1